MYALFIGHTYIDVTIVTGHVPVCERRIASEYAVSFGGNAVTAAFCCAKLGIKPDLIATGADDWLGRMFWNMAAQDTNSSCMFANAALVAVIRDAARRRARDPARAQRQISAPVSAARSHRLWRSALHIDGHQPDAALHYARACREAQGIFASLTAEVWRQHPRGAGLHRRRHRVGALCQQLKMTTEQTLDDPARLRSPLGGVTQANAACGGTTSAAVEHAAGVADPGTPNHRYSGAGDVFHGAYVHSYLGEFAKKPWVEHFQFARAAAAYKVSVRQRAGLPSRADVAECGTLAR